MTTNQFCRILAGVQGLGAEKLEAETLLQRIADLILEVCGVLAVRLRCCRIDQGKSQPEPTARVLYGDAPRDGGRPAPGAVGDLSFLGNKAVLGDMQETTTSVEVGPQHDKQIELRDGEVLVVVRSRFERWLVWSAITGDSSLGEDASVATWAETLHEIVRLITHRWEAQGRGRLRRDFYHSIADYEPSNPSVDFKYLCETWLKVSNADWCWLWLYNRETDEFELTASVSKDPSDQSHYPRKRVPLRNGSVGDFSCRKRRPAIIDDIETWEERIGTNKYTVLLRDELRNLHVRALDHIPFFDPPHDRETQSRGLVSLHYRDRRHRVSHPSDSLRVMGGTTGLFVQYVKHREEKGILIELNRIAQKYLAQTNRPPEAARKDYLADLIELIRTRLNVDGISLFYRMPFRDAVQCIGTTGLRWAKDESPITEDRLGTVVYEPKERRTGRCFATGNAIVEDFNEDFKTSEIRKRAKRGRPEPAIFVPVLAVLNPKEVIGVIRCVEHASPVFGDELCEFDDTEVERLTLIAEQVGPVLQTFEQRMAREQSISIVKHDLAVPYIMMRDTIAQFVDYEDSTDPKREYFLRTFEAASQMVASLAEPWDPDLLSKLEFDPTLPEQQIAREQAISIVKHDLAVPYIKMRDTIAQFFDYEESTDPKREYFLRNLEAASRMVASLAETLDPDPLSKLEFTPTPTYLEGDIIARLKAMISHYARVQSDMAIHFDGFRAVPKLNIDAALVERAIYNLLVNAIKYGDRGSTIEVLAQDGSDGYYVDIRNRGIGIRDGEDERVFTPGFRSERARKRAIGLGLGLAIAKDAMEKTGGELRLTSLRDPTVFTLVFPTKLRVALTGRNK